MSVYEKERERERERESERDSFLLYTERTPQLFKQALNVEFDGRRTKHLTCIQFRFILHLYT